MTNEQGRSNRMSVAAFIICVILSLSLFYFIFIFPEIVEQHFEILKVFLAASTAGILGFLPGTFKFKCKGVYATGALGVFAFLMYFVRQSETSFFVRAKVAAENIGKRKLETGSVTLDLGNELCKADLQKNDDVTFEHIPHKYLNTHVKFEINFSENYVLSYPDSTYLLENDHLLTLKIRLAFQNKVKGTVTDIYNSPIMGVAVSINADSTTTNADGFYLIVLDTANLQDEQTITFRKTGFQFLQDPIHLQTLIRHDVQLIKR